MSSDLNRSPSIRIQKFIADAGVCSRRKAEELVALGRVFVNGKRLVQPGFKVDPKIDVVEVDEKIIEVKETEKIYLVMNKPRGFVTTVHDPEGRNTVMDLCQEVTERIYPVGRLDYLSEGLLLLTNDGEFANMIMHPKFEVEKVYEVKVFGAVDERLLKELRKGAFIDGKLSKPLSVRVIKQLASKTWLEFRLGEGRNREIRRICEACGLTIDKLKRVAIGELTIHGVRPGGLRYFTKKNLLSAIGLNADGSPRKDLNKYFSPKKSINLKKKGIQAATLANDKSFVKFRKDSYFDTLKNIEENKKQRIQKEKAQELKLREEAHQKRQRKKKLRERRKAEEAKGVHASFVK